MHYLDSLISTLYGNILFTQTICLVCGSAMDRFKVYFFCKGNTWDSKRGESLKVILNILEKQWVELPRESIYNYGKGLSMVQKSFMSY